MFGVGKMLELSRRNPKKRVLVYDTTPLVAENNNTLQNLGLSWRNPKKRVVVYDTTILANLAVKHRLKSKLLLGEILREMLKGCGP